MAVIAPELVGGRNVTLFLDLLAWSEATATSPATQNDGYDVIVTGHDRTLNIFTEYDDHPFADGRAPIVLRLDSHFLPSLQSTASGRYQFLLRTWKAYRDSMHLSDFSPRSQDLLACRLIHERGALRLLTRDEIGPAISSCSNIWASLPGNGYGQGGRTMDELLNKFATLKG